MRISILDMAESSTACSSEAANKLLGHMAEYVRHYEFSTGRKPNVITLTPKQWRTLEIQARKANRTLEACQFAGVPLRQRVDDETLSRLEATD
jgi:hypothetical protein